MDTERTLEALHAAAEEAYTHEVEVCERILQEMEEVLGHGKAEDEPG